MLKSHFASTLSPYGSKFSFGQKVQPKAYPFSVNTEVTVLTPPEKIHVSDPIEYVSNIKVGRDGLIVKHGSQSGLLLPQVPIEYGWNEEDFLSHTCEKAGLPRECWKEKETQIQKFEGIVFKEEMPNGKVVRECL